ncbi:MAG: DUF2752 domain-containing protein [Flavobacterium sp.]
MTRNRLYLLLAGGIAAGYALLAFTHDNHDAPTPCIFKHLTGIACPSCGSTRSVLAISQGNFTEALLTNPLGFIIAAVLIIGPIWLLTDAALKNDSLYRAFRTFEKTIRTRWLAATLILLIAANWAWNICKDL